MLGGKNVNISVSQIQPEDEEHFLDAVVRSRGLFEEWVDPPSNSDRFAEHLAKYSADNNFSYLARDSDAELILEANIQPGNVASIALVKSLGFRLEGHSARYLKIAGEWRDHERYAITVEEW